MQALPTPLRERLLAIDAVADDDPALARRLAERLVNDERQRGDSAALAAALERLARVALKQSDTESALQALLDALALARHTGDRVAEARAHMSLRRLAHFAMDTATALLHANAARSAAQSTDDIPLFLRAVLEEQCALVDAGRFDGTVAALQQAEAIATQRGLLNENGDILCNLGYVYAALNEFVAGEQAAREAAAIAMRLKDDDLLSAVLTVLGANLAGQGRFDEAISTMHHAIELHERPGTRAYLAEAKLDFADVLRLAGRIDEALALSNKAATLARAQSQWSFLIRALERARHLHTLRGDADSAQRCEDEIAAVRADTTRKYAVLRERLRQA